MQVCTQTPGEEEASSCLPPRLIQGNGEAVPRVARLQVFFINHRYDGTVLWQLRGVPGMHELVWTLSLVSFFFLYPSTFNLLEVAAVDTPRVHLWGTGIARITRHPQASLPAALALFCTTQTTNALHRRVMRPNAFL